MDCGEVSALKIAPCTIVGLVFRLTVSREIMVAKKVYLSTYCLFHCLLLLLHYYSTSSKNKKYSSYLYGPYSIE